MSSTKITEFDLDPNMDMAKESSLQEVKTAVENIPNNFPDDIAKETTTQEILGKLGMVKGLDIVASDSVIRTLVNAEKEVLQNSSLTIGQVTVRNLSGSIRVSAALKAATSDGYPQLKIYVNDVLLTTLAGSGATYTTQTYDVQVNHNDKLRFDIYGQYSKAYCNLLTISGELVEYSDDDYFV